MPQAKDINRPKAARKRQRKQTAINNNPSKSLETVFSIAICRQSGDKWKSKILFLAIFTGVLDCRLSGVFNQENDRLSGVFKQEND